MGVISDPPAAVAAGLCLTARSIDREGVTAQHPRPCAWCDYPLPELLRLVDGYNQWAGWSERAGTFERHEARVFAELPREEQRRMVLEAQGMVPESQPVRTEEPALSHGEGVGGSDPSARRVAKDRSGCRVSGRSGSDLPSEPSEPADDDGLDLAAWT
jgi:hypothetical protein